MKHHDITKLCADSLQNYVSDPNKRIGYIGHNFSYNEFHLKSSHAHELVASFFGYKSKIALLADKEHPISKLDQVEHIITPDDLSIITSRRDALNLHESFKRSFGSFEIWWMLKDILREHLNTLGYPFIGLGSFPDLAVHYAKEHLKNRCKALGINDENYDEGMWDYDEQIYSDHAKLTVTTIYNTGSGIDTKSHRDSKLTITIPRIAGHIGYGKAEVIPTVYSGQFRDPNYNPDSDINLDKQQVLTH